MRHVLVIEDQFLIAQCLKDMVMLAGASSVEIVSGEDAAVEAARRHPPTVIVSDVTLAQGRGPEAVARIRMLCGRVPAIFVTGEPDDPGAREAATALLTKPCTAEQFARTFRTVARSRWNARRGTTAL